MDGETLGVIVGGVIGILAGIGVLSLVFGLWGLGRPGKGAWYSDSARCPMCDGFNTPRYHQPESVDCPARTPASVRATHHNHIRCRQCGYEWTLPPRNPKAVA